MNRLVNEINEKIAKQITEIKKDVGCQMHEMCSMVEEIAGMAKGVEFQLNSKKNEIECSTLNISNLQRKIDEIQRENHEEFSTIKNRQNELTQLYSTYLDSEEQLLMQQTQQEQLFGNAHLSQNSQSAAPPNHINLITNYSIDNTFNGQAKTPSNLNQPINMDLQSVETNRPQKHHSHQREVGKQKNYVLTEENERGNPP